MIRELESCEGGMKILRGGTPSGQGKKSKGKRNPGSQARQSRRNAIPMKSTVILGDSMVKGLRNKQMTQDTGERVSIQAFPGCKVDHIKVLRDPTSAQKP